MRCRKDKNITMSYCFPLFNYNLRRLLSSQSFLLIIHIFLRYNFHPECTLSCFSAQLEIALQALYHFQKQSATIINSRNSLEINNNRLAESRIKQRRQKSIFICGNETHRHNSLVHWRARNSQCIKLVLKALPLWRNDRIITRQDANFNRRKLNCLNLSI